MKRLQWFAAAAATLCFASLAVAAPKSYHYEIPWTTSDWIQSVQVQQFDTDLGTLDCISISIGVNLVSTFTAENKSSMTAKVGNVMVDGTATLYDSNFTALASADMATLKLIDGVTTLAPFDGVLDSTGDDSITRTGSRDWSFRYTFDESNPFFNVFVGDGTAATPISVSAFALCGAGGSVDRHWDTSAMATVDVDYYYTPEDVPTPEPGGLLAMFSGIVGVFGFARTRRR